MPRLGSPVKKSRILKTKKLQKTALSANFFVAPTTPVIFKSRQPKTISLNGRNPSPSAHLVDLRNAVAGRPQATPSSVLMAPKKKSKPFLFSPFNVPRTISEYPDRSGWNGKITAVAFLNFIFSALKLFFAGLVKLAIFPAIAIAGLADRFDRDRVAEDRETTGAPTTVASRPFNFRRAVVSFAGLSLAIILPFQGLTFLKSGNAAAPVGNDDKTVTLSETTDLETILTEAKSSISELNFFSEEIIKNIPNLGGKNRFGKEIITAGDQLSTASGLLSRSFEYLNDPALPVTDKILKTEKIINDASPYLSAGLAAIKTMDALPAGISGDLSAIRAKATKLYDFSKKFTAMGPDLRKILGEEQSRRYLVIFQNNAELRPTGGFIGSFALIDVERGAIKKVEVPAGGPYDLQGSLKATVLAPEPIRLISSKWEFQDANWFPDFPTAAKKLAWFYSQSNGPSVDGVIAINAPVLAKLLDVTGPIPMPAYGVVATGTSVLGVAQEIVESDKARENNKPKQFIADLMPLVLERVIGGKDAAQIKTAAVFINALNTKDIQISLFNESAQKLISSLGWSGELPTLPAGFDALGLIRTNIAGGKTDTVMATSVKHEARVAPDGTVADRVTVTLAHNGKKGDKFSGVRNVSYLRVYVPEGSRLISASGDIRPPAPTLFDLPCDGCYPDQTLAKISGPVMHDVGSGTAVNNEFGYTVFGVWTQTDPGAASAVTFEYTLPFSLSFRAGDNNFKQALGLKTSEPETTAFGLFLFKQSGAANTTVKTTLELPADWYASYAQPAGIATKNGWSHEISLEKDKTLGIVIAR
jgi:hypothetical protein